MSPTFVTYAKVADELKTFLRNGSSCEFCWGKITVTTQEIKMNQCA